MPGVTSRLEGGIRLVGNVTRSIVRRLRLVPYDVTALTQSASDPLPCPRVFRLGLPTPSARMRSPAAHGVAAALRTAQAPGPPPREALGPVACCSLAQPSLLCRQWNSKILPWRRGAGGVGERQQHPEFAPWGLDVTSGEAASPFGAGGSVVVFKLLRF